MRKTTLHGENIAIPAHLNIAIAAAAGTASVGLLYAASHASSFWILLACGVAFSFINNTLFGMMHDAVHFAAHPSRKANHALGVFVSLFFPTGFTFQRICHLNHHRNNRTDVEMFEAYYPNDNKLLKRIQWYGLLLGGYWPMYVIGLMLYVLCPWLLRAPLLRDTKNKSVKHTGADAYIRLFDEHPHTRRIKLEIVGSFAFQASLFYFLDLHFGAWLFCYWMFSLHWGALQYADHAYTKRDIRFGAWTLEVNRFTRYLFLNYHYHLVHHTYPYVPWLHLGKFVDPNEERPSFWRIYFKMWRGPVLTTDPSPKKLERAFEELLENGLVPEDTPPSERHAGVGSLEMADVRQ